MNILWFGESLEVANHLQSLPNKSPRKSTNLTKKTDKIIIVALKIICEVILQQIVDKFCASVKR
jgi:hypothetical protein